MDLHKNKEKKSRAKNFDLYKKKSMFVSKIKRQNSSTILPILSDSRKEKVDITSMFSRNP